VDLKLFGAAFAHPPEIRAGSVGQGLVLPGKHGAGKDGDNT